MAREEQPCRPCDRAADAAHQPLAADPPLPGLGRGDALHGRQIERRRAGWEAHRPPARAVALRDGGDRPAPALLRSRGKVGYADSYLAFWGRYLAADGSFCTADGCLKIPSWGHLWFVAYLLAYTLLLAAALAWLRAPLLRLGDWLARRLTGWALLVWPILFLAAARVLLYPAFEVTHAFIDDWYNHATSFFAFLFGFLLIKDRRVAAECVRLRWVALASFLAAYAAYASYAWAYRDADALPPEPLLSAMRAAFAVDQWCAVIAALGFGALYLNRDSALLRTLTIAVFPFYIVHQTIVIAVGHHLA
jgi:glucan biosynthesis protein C